MANHLLKLRDFEIVIVCDDSGSMTMKVDNTEKTRWDELRSIVKVIIEIGVIFDSNGVDIHFLNRNKFLKVKNHEEVEKAFEIFPSGYTPLVPVLKEIFESRLARRGNDKKLLVFVATDGEPTDEDGNSVIPELERLMKETREKETTYVSFLVCTDDLDSIKYLDAWDRTMPNVDVTDDFCTEKETICRCQEDKNYPFTYGDYIVKALVGAIIPVIDRLNERKIGTMPCS
jgi:nitric oxide reductase activation protein